MNWNEVLENAKDCSGPFCHACPVCNGRACSNHLPGPGAKGTGDVAIRNYEAWQKIRINMNTISANREPDTSFDFFGKKLRLPVMAGPVGAVQLHYGKKYDDVAYNNILVPAAAEAGIIAFTGDGTNPDVIRAATASIKANGGTGVPTIKPWDINTLQEKFALVADARPFAIAMDVDAAGLPFLQGLTPPAGSKTVEELRDVIQKAGKPFIVKGIMTVRGALAARDAGAAAIVVSNHGGRVQDQTPSTAEVLEQIADAVHEADRRDGLTSLSESGCDSAHDREASAPGRKPMMILVDGGIRNGVDIFKALALGADACLIARPYVTAVYGGAAEGVKALTDRLYGELTSTMKMCGVASLSEITKDCLFKPESAYVRF